MNEENEKISQLQAQLKARGINEDGTLTSDSSESAAIPTGKLEMPTALDNKSAEVIGSESESTIEQEAMAKGWKAGGEKSAEEFLRAEPLYEEIKSRGKEIKELKRTLDELKSHLEKKEQLGYQKALEELHQERTHAIELGDVSAVNSLDKKISEQQEKLPKSIESDIPTEAKQFMDKYKSFLETNVEARIFVLERDEQLGRFGLTPAEHMALLEKEMKQKFNEDSLFAPQKSAPTSSAVESDSAPITTKSKKTFTFSDLNKDQQKIARDFERMGVLTREQYIAELVKLGEIK